MDVPISKPAGDSAANLESTAAESVLPTTVRRAERPNGSSHAPAGTWVDGRYRIESLLGRGGMGLVYRATDTFRDRVVALKRPLPGPGKTLDKVAAYLQREYNTLAQLRHPMVIEVYDYGHDDEGPYYTMELLEGDDLRHLAPVPWRDACRILRDVASSLAILHSRRLLHRDVSPGNIRLDASGRAKLIDFGTMTSIGSVNRVVGTIPYIAPEAVQQQPLDARTDLFALGGIAYWLLSGRQAFPARSVRELAELWAMGPHPIDTDFDAPPKRLVDLMTSLLQVEPLARPSHAAEVIELLNAIADLEPQGPAETAQAYLNVPSLIGRLQEILEFQRRLEDFRRGRGGRWLITGPPGIGRTRLLARCALEARVDGAVVVSAAARDVEPGSTVLDALLEDLIEEMPEVAADCAGEVAHRLALESAHLRQRLQAATGTALETGASGREDACEAVMQWLRAIARRRPLLLAVDDIQECDRDSAARLAMLSGAQTEEPILLVGTLRDDPHARDAPGSADAIRALQNDATVKTLLPLNQNESETLLRSMFGDASYVRVVAAWVYGLSEGNPRTCIELAQYLVDQKHARFEGGLWTLPSSLGNLGLPLRVGQALESKVRSLSAGALRIAQALSLASEDAPLRLEDYPRVLERGDATEAFRALDELEVAGVVSGAAARYDLIHKGMADVVRSTMSDQTETDLHRMLAEVYQAHEPQNVLLVVHHLQRGGEEARAFELLLPLLRQSYNPPGSYPLQIACCERALAFCETQDASPHAAFYVRRTLLRMGSRYDRTMFAYAPVVLQQLRRDTGLVHWDEAPHDDETARLDYCLRTAEEAYRTTPEPMRGLAPAEALQELAVYATMMTSFYGTTYDVEGMESLGEILRPLRGISPLMRMLHDNIAMITKAIRGAEQLDLRRAVITSMRSPVSGLDEATRDGLLHINMFYAGLNEAEEALDVAFERADALSKHPRYAPMAWQIRTVTHLFRGEPRQAATCVERWELLNLQMGEGDTHRAGAWLRHAAAHALCHDLMSLKEALGPIAQEAEQAPGWRPHLWFVRGEYHRLRGELEEARRELAQLLPLGPDEHVAWRRGIAAYVYTLADLGELETAREVAEHSLQQCVTHHVDRTCTRELERALAIIEAKAGELGTAAERLDRAIAQARDRGAMGVPLGSLHEARAWVAAFANEQDAFGQHVADTERLFRPGGHRALILRVERLVELGRSRELLLQPRYDDRTASHGRPSLRDAATYLTETDE